MNLLCAKAIYNIVLYYFYAVNFVYFVYLELIPHPIIFVIHLKINGIYIHVCMYVRTYVCMYVCIMYVLCMYVCVYVCMYVCMCMYVLFMYYVCMYVCMYVCVLCTYVLFMYECIMYVCMLSLYYMDTLNKAAVLTI
jgi:nuclear pore complex protein Nup62